MKVRIPDIPGPPHGTTRADVTARWNSHRGKFIEVGKPFTRQTLLAIGFEPKDDCNSEWFWPLLNPDMLGPIAEATEHPMEIRFWVCCHEIEVD